MSNEYKDWEREKIQDIVLERGLADRTLSTSETPFVNGIKDGQPVRFEVWFDMDLNEWRCERRELETNI